MRVAVAGVGALLAIGVVTGGVVMQQDTTVTAVSSEVSPPMTVRMKPDQSLVVKCDPARLGWQRNAPRAGTLTCPVPTTVPPTTTVEPSPTTTVPTTTTTSTTDPLPAGCALPRYPDASCTGVPDGTTLQQVGSLNLNTPGQVVERKDIRGCVTVSAPGVVIRDSRISGDCFYLIDAYGFTGEWLTVEDTTLVCSGGTAIGEERVIARRVDISGCENGFDINHSMLIEDSWIHDMLQEGGPGDPHSDGAQLVPGATNVTFRHNHIDMTLLATSSIISPTGTGATGSILLTDNLFMGGGYSVYCNQGGKGVDYRLIGNRFSTKYGPSGGRAAPWTECTDESVVIDNRWYDGANAGRLLPGHP